MNMGDRSLEPVMSRDETRSLFAILAGNLERELAAMEPEEREEMIKKLEARGVRFKGRSKNES